MRNFLSRIIGTGRFVPFVGGLVVLAMLAGGCSSSSIGDREQQIVLVSGAGGGGGYGGLREGLRDAGIQIPIATFRWGAPTPLFMLNLQNRGIHNAAESSLARKIGQWRARHHGGRLIFIGHSAGCGVILGALAKLAVDADVDQVILLAPSVSPGYDLGPALAHIRQRLDVFYSDRDTIWLKWRTGTFGTYDNIRTPAAGNTGFTSVSVLPADLKSKVVQHAYDPAWRQFGNDGGHWGTISRRFVERVLVPLCEFGNP